MDHFCLIRLLYKSGDLICSLPNVIQAGSREDGTDSTAHGAGFWQTQTSDSASTSRVSVSTAPAGEYDGVCIPPDAQADLTEPMHRGGNCACMRYRISAQRWRLCMHALENH